MKTKVNVHLVYNTRNGRNSVTAEVILPKLNYVQGSGALRNTKLELEPENRLTADELDLMVSERKDLKVVVNRDMNIICEADAYKSYNPDGTANYWLTVVLSEHVKRTFFFNRTQILNLPNCKYGFEFEEKLKDTDTIVLPLKDEAKPDKK